MKTFDSICLELIACNKDTNSNLHINFLRILKSIYGVRNYLNLLKLYNRCLLWSWKNKIQLKFSQKFGFKGSND